VSVILDHLDKSTQNRRSMGSTALRVPGFCAFCKGAKPTTRQACFRKEQDRIMTDRSVTELLHGADEEHGHRPGLRS